MHVSLFFYSGGVLRGRVDVDVSTTETESMMSSSRHDFYDDDESTITSVSQIANCKSILSNDIWHLNQNFAFIVVRELLLKLGSKNILGATTLSKTTLSKMTIRITMNKM